jgi:hypothetical protein
LIRPDKGGGVFRGAPQIAVLYSQSENYQVVLKK